MAAETLVRETACIYYPQQVLPALAAAITCRSGSGADPVAPLDVILWHAGASPAERLRRTSLVERMLRPFPWARVWAANGAVFEGTMSRSVTIAAKARVLRRAFQGGDVRTIYYPHDLTSDFVPSALTRAFPGAMRVCFGDGLGMVYGRRYFESHMYAAASWRGLRQTPSRALRHGLARWRRAILAPRPWRPADRYALIMPHDPSGACISKENLTVVTRSCAGAVRDVLRAAVQDQHSARQPLPPPAAPLVLLGSFVESRMLTEDDAVRLYQAALREHVPEGSTILLKPHGASRPARIERLAAALRSHYNPEVISDETAEIPVELLDTLVVGRRVLSFSHASIALRYFGLGTPVHALTDDLIVRFFPDFIRPWLLESNSYFLQPWESAAPRGVQDGA